MRRAALAGMLVLALAACGPAPPTPPASTTVQAPTPESTPAPASVEPAATPALPASADAVNPFSVQLIMSDKALAKLKQVKEGVRLLAVSYVAPQPGVPVAPGDSGVPLSEEEVIIPPSSKMIAFNGRFDPNIVTQSGQGAPRVKVTVNSARATQPDALLSCGAFDDTLAAAQTSPVQIVCKLVGEP